MAAISKEKRDKLKKELADRYLLLMKRLTGRNLRDEKEGLQRGRWRTPEEMCWVDSIDVALAVGDFKTILSEILKIK
jgi:hypothetical protein